MTDRRCNKLYIVLEDKKCYKKENREYKGGAGGCNFKLGVRVSLIEEVTVEQGFKDMRKFLIYWVTWGNTQNKNWGLIDTFANDAEGNVKKFKEKKALLLQIPRK